jgi:hypothetical protein
MQLSSGRWFPTGDFNAGFVRRAHDVREVASGVFVYGLTAKQGVVTRRMTLLR